MGVEYDLFLGIEGGATSLPLPLPKWATLVDDYDTIKAFLETTAFL